MAVAAREEKRSVAKWRNSEKTKAKGVGNGSSEEIVKKLSK